DDIDRKWPDEELEIAAREGHFETEGWRLRKNGSAFWANVVITVLQGPGGDIQGFSKVVRDLTGRKRAEEDLRVSEERFRLLVDGVKDYGLYLLDPTGRIVSWNAGAERIKGYRAQEVLGRHFSLFYPPEDLARGKPDHELQAARYL